MRRLISNTELIIDSLDEEPINLRSLCLKLNLYETTVVPYLDRLVVNGLVLEKRSRGERLFWLSESGLVARVHVRTLMKLIS